jgi:hypothetical protein
MGAMIFVESLPMWQLRLFGQLSPAAPYWRSCAAEEMKIAITNVSYAASQIINLKTIHLEAIISKLNLNLTVECTIASDAAAVCHFWQDAHRRMALVIARILRAEECHQAVKTFHVIVFC